MHQVRRAVKQSLIRTASAGNVHQGTEDYMVENSETAVID